jgi:transaldolase
LRLFKIPATYAGMPAIEEMTSRGYAINVTLIFSLARHHQIAEAYLRGLERLVASGGDPSRIHSVASFFVSRFDTETGRRLVETGRGDLKGHLGIANAKLAYQQYKHRATRRIREPPSDAEIERGLREKAVTDPRAAEILLRWLQRPRQDNPTPWPSGGNHGREREMTVSRTSRMAEMT